MKRIITFKSEIHQSVILSDIMSFSRVTSEELDKKMKFAIHSGNRPLLEQLLSLHSNPNQNVSPDPFNHFLSPLELIVEIISFKSLSKTQLLEYSTMTKMLLDAGADPEVAIITIKKYWKCNDAQLLDSEVGKMPFSIFKMIAKYHIQILNETKIIQLT